jgi:outer membrane receptor for ferrienterochelin and colicin
MKHLLYIFLISSINIICLNAQPITKPDSLQSEIPSLESLLDAKVTIASNREENLQSAPGMITIITAEEIRHSAARDLIDVLRTVPGLDFAQDVESIIGAGVRGLWAQEGKFLLLIDGLEMNETAYNTLQFMQHFPIYNIHQIEIMRGPGSVIYGGNASLAVVNIITKNGLKLSGLTVGGIYGQLSNINARRQLFGAIGKEFKNGLSIAASGHLQAGNFSNQTVMNSSDSMLVNYKDSSKVSSSMFLLKANYQDVELKYLIDNHFHDVSQSNFSYRHLTHIFSLKYTYEINEKLSIIPSIWQKNQFPWRYENYHDSVFLKNMNNIRTEGNVLINFTNLNNFNLTGGLRYMQDNSTYYESDTLQTFTTTGTNAIMFYTYSAFLHSSLKNKIVNLTGGLRFEKHNAYEAVLLPRINLSKDFGKFTAEYQYSEAFRAPSIQNIDLGNNIRPEKVYHHELEFQYAFDPNSHLSLSYFLINIRNPILYLYVNETEFYKNTQRVGSSGIEAEYQLKKKKDHLKASYSFYNALANSSPYFSVNGQPGTFLAFPNHKFTLQHTHYWPKSLFHHITAIYYSNRFGINAAGEQFETGNTLLLSASIGLKGILKGIDFSAGVADILNQQYQFIQAYNSGNDPLPGPGRELFIKFRYHLPW